MPPIIDGGVDIKITQNSTKHGGRLKSVKYPKMPTDYIKVKFRSSLVAAIVVANEGRDDVILRNKSWDLLTSDWLNPT